METPIIDAKFYQAVDIGQLSNGMGRGRPMVNRINPEILAKEIGVKTCSLWQDLEISCVVIRGINKGKAVAVRVPFGNVMYTIEEKEIEGGENNGKNSKKSKS